MSDTGQTTNQAVKDLGDLLGNARICMLTTTTEDGKHVSRPMAVQDAEFDGDLWFFTYDDSDKARHVAKNPEVNVAFADDKHYGGLRMRLRPGAARLAFVAADGEVLDRSRLRCVPPSGP